MSKNLKKEVSVITEICWNDTIEHPAAETEEWIRNEEHEISII